jgi:hypothetical protein
MSAQEKALALKRAAELYVAACLADGPHTERPIARGAFLEGIAIEYADAVREEKKKSRAARARARR